MIETYTIYSKKMAGYLLIKGANLLYLETNTNDPALKVFKFIKSKKLERLIENYQNQKVTI